VLLFSSKTQLLLWYGVATLSRLLKIICLFCRTSSLLYGSFAKETCSFQEPTNEATPHDVDINVKSGSLRSDLFPIFVLMKCSRWRFPSVLIFFPRWFGSVIFLS